jgi:2-polyprenyl-3-methyl-5-hydroxy-6-metoxy-1,4-benzoquinol methylase
MALNSYKTAIGRPYASLPVRIYMQQRYNNASSKQTILDYGCGRGTDAYYLSANANVVKYDPHYHPSSEWTKHTYDTIFLTYVLNVLETQREMVEAIENCLSVLKPGGQLIITSRSITEIRTLATRKNWTPFGAGFITSLAKKTFQNGSLNTPLYMKLFNDVGNRYKFTLLLTKWKHSSVQYILTKES